MRTLSTLMGMVFLSVHLHAQIYIDPAVAAATGAHAAVINGQLNTTNDNLTLIQRGQLAVTGQLVIVNDLQDKIYKGLSEVSSVVRNLLAVKDIADISTDIVRDVNKAMDIAGSNPILLLFAEQGAREFKTRATKLAAEVASVVTVGGRQNLMYSGAPAKRLNRTVTARTILRAVAYGMYRSMYWAKQRGVLSSPTPYAGFINIDKRIGGD